MAMVGVASGSLEAAYRRTNSPVVWPGLRVGGRLAPFHIHHMNRVNSCSGFRYNESTINIIILIIIIIIKR